MPDKFHSFSPAVLSFFRQLAKHNEREWFDPRKAFYKEQVYAPMVQLVDLLNKDLRSFAGDHIMEPKEAIYRIYRDTRFSKDKTPYKTHIAAIFPRRGMAKHAGAGFYFQLSHESLEIAGGVYMPGPMELLAVRKAIADQPARWQRLLADKATRRRTGILQGDKLTRVPKGFDPTSPVADYLRMKQWYFDIEFDAKETLRPTLRKTIIDRFHAMAPMVHYLNNVILKKLSETQGSADAMPQRPEPMF